ncbi:hypothetical protein E3N88_21756 [Mikania micrantha]|uniref:Uncharacterized protein n=1 Tax=Mikania micrantha TaxID=192012 RepID=A0A5N6NB35_9ASTR|nr:hypothetical protein E3N88_21756 [Mikania micrantha]
MMNMGENRVQNGVTDCPESRNEVSVGKWEKWPSRYAEEEIRSLRGTRCLEISEISPDFFAVRETHFSYLRGLRTVRLHPGTFIRVHIIFLPAELLRNRLNSIMELKVLILELYLVNPCVAEQKTLIVLLVDTPFTGRIASPLVNSNSGEDALLG